MRFEIKPADAKTAVADDEHDLLSRSGELSANRHADAVADGRNGPASRIWPGKRAWKYCEIQPLIVKLSITMVAS